jgi:hypothetical protein
MDAAKTNRLEAISTLIALIGLIGAIVFNGIQVRQAKEATELQLLTDLHGALAQTETQLQVHNTEILNVISAREDEQESGRPNNRDKTLNPSTQRVVDVAGANMEYLAFLFERGHIELAGSDRLWGDVLSCQFRDTYVGLELEPGDAARDYPYLGRFARKIPCRR